MAIVSKLRAFFQYRAVVSTMCVGVVLSAAGAVAIRHLEQERFRSEFLAGADRRVRAIRRQVDDDLSALNALRGFMEVPRAFTTSDFDKFAQRLLESHPSLLAVEWVARVRGAGERRQFEEEMRRNGAADSGITERRPGGGRPAAERDEYFPVRFLAPMTPANHRALGYDLKSCNSCRDALAVAATTDQAAAMQRLTTLERDGYAVAVVLPVFEDPGTAGSSQRELAAYAMVMLHVGQVVESALESLDPQGIQLDVYDGSPGTVQNFLYHHRSRFDTPTAALQKPKREDVGIGPHFSSGIAVGNHTWRLIFTPIAARIAAAQTWWPWTFFLCGIVFTGAVTGYFQARLAHADESAKLLNKLTEHTDRLIESEERIRQVLASAPDAIITMNTKGNITGWNPQAESMFGWSADEALGRTLAELIIPIWQREAYERGLKRLGQSRESRMLNRMLELTGVRRDGSEFPAEVTTVPVVIGGESQFSSFVRDMTERKHLQEQLLQAQKMESVGQLAGGIAHDFNNLLTVITGAAQLAEMNQKTHLPTSKELAAIRAAAAKAASLTQQILAYSRKQVLQPTNVDLNELVSQVVAMVRRLIGEHIAISLELEEELWPVRVDRGQFEQVVINMAINARDAMPHGGRLTIRTQNVQPEDADAGGGYVRLTVSDTGIGMDEQTQQNIFDPFFTTKRPGEGTGLGLSMVYGFVKQSDGDIRVTSSEGKGTMFTILLPRVEAEIAASQAAVSAPTVVRGKETILVVEDEDLVRELVEQVLAAIGYTVHAAASGPEALAILNGANGLNIRLVVTDLMMPEMDGRELAEAIEAGHPGTKILFTSGYVGDGLGELREGAPFIQKPYNLEDLARKVRELLDSSA